MIETVEEGYNHLSGKLGQAQADVESTRNRLNQTREQLEAENDNLTAEINALRRQLIDQQTANKTLRESIQGTVQVIATKLGLPEAETKSRIAEMTCEGKSPTETAATLENFLNMGADELIKAVEDRDQEIDELNEELLQAEQALLRARERIRHAKQDIQS